MDILSKLCAWYKQQYVPETHEDVGIEIGTLDNPGWSLKVDLEETELKDRVFNDVKIDRTDDDWLVARRNGIKFEAFGGVNNLAEMIEVFLDWAD